MTNKEEVRQELRKELKRVIDGLGRLTIIEGSFLKMKQLSQSVISLIEGETDVYQN